MADFAQLTLGEVFAGRYRVEYLVAAGGMGAVYAAVHTGTLRKVALKVMRPEIVADAGARARFAKEAQVSARLESPNVVDVLDAGIDAQTGIPYFVMELLVGKELGNLLKERGRFTPQEVVTWLAQAARALDKAHAADIIHRDLKPENLFLVMREGEAPIIKVLDFGIARIREGATNAATMAGGTPLYMAPEQTSRSATIGPHTDVWALALTAYTLIVGAPYWNVGDNLMSLYQEVLTAPLESPGARAARWGVQLPPAFDAWFFRCVNRDPNTRLSRASEAMRQLGEVFGVVVEISRQFAVQTPQPPPAEMSGTVMSPQQFVPPSAHGTAIPNQYGATAAPATQAAAPAYAPSAGAAGTVVGSSAMYVPAATGGGAPVIPQAPYIPPNVGHGTGPRQRGGGGGGGASPVLLGVLGLLAFSAIGFGVYMAVKPSGNSAATDESKKDDSKDDSKDDDEKKKQKASSDDDDKKDPEKDKKKALQDEDDDEGVTQKKKTQPKPIGNDTVDDTPTTPPPPPPPPPKPQPTPTFANPPPKPKPPTGSNCAPGVVNEFGRCSCPAGFKSFGAPGNAKCVAQSSGDDDE